MTKTERNNISIRQRQVKQKKFQALVEIGFPLSEIAKLFGISRQRVHQILNNYHTPSNLRIMKLRKVGEYKPKDTKITNMKLTLPNGIIIEDATAEDVQAIVHGSRLPQPPKEMGVANTSPSLRRHKKRKYSYTFISRLLAKCDLCGMKIDYRGMSGHYRKLHKDIFKQLHIKRKRPRKKNVKEEEKKPESVLDRILG